MDAAQEKVALPAIVEALHAMTAAVGDESSAGGHALVRSTDMKHGG